jgi:hypothetical protein
VEQVLYVLLCRKNFFKWLVFKIVGQQPKDAPPHLAISVCLFFYYKIQSSYFLFFSSLAKATYAAMAMTYSYLTPDLWKETVYTKTPFQEYSDHLANTHKKYTVGVGDKHYQ